MTLQAQLIGLGVLLLAIAVLGVATHIEHGHIVELKKDKAELARDLATATKGNIAQKALLATQAADLLEWKQRANEAQSASAAAAAAAQAYRLLAERHKRELDVRIARELQDAECAGFLSQDLAKSCPTVAGALKEAK